jgi:hypothetical protein
MVGVNRAVEAVGVGSSEAGVEGEVDDVEPVRLVPAPDLADPEHDDHKMITTTSSTPSTTARRRQ